MSIIADLHDMIAGFRCAGTGRMVKAGVSMTHMHVMWLLDHHGDLHMGQLAELVDVSMSNATGIVDRMEERGLVERVRVPNDRRVVLVRLTPAGVQAIETMEAIKQDRVRGILGRLEASQLTRVAAALSDLRQAVLAELGPDYGSGHGHPNQVIATERN
ncbi:MAG: MarR family transcriptional regulator [Chloroflexi bacterium]|nr:MarR family transcriptional regulator [Chloroflexota bacterium]